MPPRPIISMVLALPLVSHTFEPAPLALTVGDTDQAEGEYRTKDEDNADDRVIAGTSNAYGIGRMNTVHDLDDYVSKYREANIVARLSTAHCLLEALDDPTPCTFFNAKEADRYPSLLTVGGRACAIFDRITAAEDPGFPEDRPEDRRGRVATTEERVRCLRALRAAAITTARDFPAGLTDEQAAEKYRGRIRPDLWGVEGMRTGKVLHSLLGEWFPLGRKLSDLEEIVGIRTTELASKRCYEFGGPQHAYAYEFILDNGVIVAVLLD